MRIFAVDDELLILRDLIKNLTKCMPSAEIQGFSTSVAAIKALDGDPVDIAFLDIEIGSISGVDLAKKIKEKFPFCNIIFCTGYDNFAVQAFNLGASDYLMKPITEEKILHALSQLRYISEIKPIHGKLFVRCFGEFEVFWDGAPLNSLTKKSKELFAFLIDKAGAFCNSAEIIRTLFPNNSDSYFRVVKKDLIKSLDEIGAEDVLIREWSRMSIDKSRVVCDYYEYLSGNPSAVNLNKGVYMNQYDWANNPIDIF